jgi:ABC-2 type transport system ATP-binding protein
MANDGVASLRRLLDRLDDDAVAGLSVQSADLDDVFLALTGRTAGPRDGAQEVARLEEVR